MAFKDYARALLNGGLPAVLDLGVQAAPGAQGDTTRTGGRVEQTPPEPTKKDLEPFLQRTVKITEDFEINLLGAIVGGIAITGFSIFLITRAFR